MTTPPVLHRAESGSPTFESAHTTVEVIRPGEGIGLGQVRSDLGLIPVARNFVDKPTSNGWFMR